MSKAGFHAIVRTVPHHDQRYDTVGDWCNLPGLVSYSPDGPTAPLLKITVSDLGDWRMNALVAVHELIEAALCRHRGISEESVTAFDERFSRENETGEPGDHPDAPYSREHCFATGVERLLAVELEVDWSRYEARIAKL